jgi:hypothetical protein
MTAMIGSADCPPHRLAAARYAAAGEIGLIPSPGGFRTPPFGADGRFLAVDGAELVPNEGPPQGYPAFWNGPFGAARSFRQIGTLAEAAAFFHDGRVRVRAATIPTMRTL